MSNEYQVTQLTERVRELEQTLLEETRHNTDILLAEVMLAIVCFLVGYVIGSIYG
jgi:hypothetical protein